MNHIKHFLTITTAGLALLSSGFSLAQGNSDGESLREHAEFRSWKGSKSRAEVRAELLAAQRAGEIVSGEAGIDRALFADVKSEKTRAQVRAETLAAPRTGQPVSGEAGVEQALFDDFKSEKTRAQVRAEMLEARRLGLIPHGEGSEHVTVSPAQAELIRLAGLRAIDPTRVAAAR